MRVVMSLSSKPLMAIARRFSMRFAHVKKMVETPSASLPATWQRARAPALSSYSGADCVKVGIARAPSAPRAWWRALACRSLLLSWPPYAEANKHDIPVICRWRHQVLGIFQGYCRRCLRGHGCFAAGRTDESPGRGLPLSWPFVQGLSRHGFPLVPWRAVRQIATSRRKCAIR